ncbi:hypothetical protein DM806_09745 [Sphingobium lactosutens]|uniref:hypothetical protein n=1 Tax=Sphingobium lactosutens TaxID=522773 RepID=UPI0015BA1781|nr:hypothetical protein [Sphingobium lactosutens]NWK95952.1 hypothetical protein [Sphingobium lactosutens]
MIRIYFNAERTGGLRFIIVGTIALVIALAVWGWRHGPFWWGVAWVLAVSALIQINVGITYWWRSPDDLERVQHLVAQEPGRIVGEEVPRMQAVLKSYAISIRIEIAVLAAGLALLVLSPHGSAWQGAGMGLAVQTGLVLLLDGLAERRGQAYLQWLLAFMATSPDAGIAFGADSG